MPDAFSHPCRSRRGSVVSTFSFYSFGLLFFVIDRKRPDPKFRKSLPPLAITRHVHLPFSRTSIICSLRRGVACPPTRRKAPLRFPAGSQGPRPSTSVPA